jgi:hypothetical protein
MEDEENIQDLKNGIIARDNIIELYRKKYNDPLIESEIQKLQTNENQILLLKDNINPNKDNIILQLNNQIESLQKENENYKKKLNLIENQANQYKIELEKNNNNNKIYKEQIEQVLKQLCENKFLEINNKLNEFLNKKIEFFLKKHEKQGAKSIIPEQDSKKVKDLKDFILNLKNEIDNKVKNFNQIGVIGNINSFDSSIIQNSFSEINPNDSIDVSYIKEVSFECTNKSPLSVDVYEGTERAEIEICLKNNGNKTWLEGRTKLVFERESKINGENIILRPQKPGETDKYKIVLKGLQNLPATQYKSYLGFFVGFNEIGEQLVITINIKKIVSNEHYL